MVAAADETTLVLVAAEDLEPGMTLSASDLNEQAVRFDGGLDRYIAAGSALDGYRVVRSVAAGELVPASAVVPTDSDAADDLRYITMAIPSQERPAGLGRGSHVDVWVDPEDGAGPDEVAGVAEQLLTDVVVTDFDQGGGGLSGPSDSVSVTLAVTARGADSDAIVARLISAARAEQVFLTVVPQAGSR